MGKFKILREKMAEPLPGTEGLLGILLTIFTCIGMVASGVMFIVDPFGTAGYVIRGVVAFGILWLSLLAIV